MAEYDPKRNRRPAGDADIAADLTDPVQIDAILDRTSDGDIPALADDLASMVHPSPVVDLRSDRSSPTRPDRAAGTPTAPAPDRSTQRVAVVAGIAAATTAAIWLVRRARRND